MTAPSGPQAQPNDRHYPQKSIVILHNNPSMSSSPSSPAGPRHRTAHGEEPASPTHKKSGLAESDRWSVSPPCMVRALPDLAAARARPTDSGSWSLSVHTVPVACEETKREGNKSQNRPPRQCTNEFKAATAQQVRGEDRRSAALAHSLDLTPLALHQWVKQALVDSGRGAEEVLTSSEREELAQLLSENRRLAILRFGSEKLKKGLLLESEHRRTEQ